MVCSTCSILELTSCLAVKETTQSQEITKFILDQGVVTATNMAMSQSTWSVSRPSILVFCHSTFGWDSQTALLDLSKSSDFPNSWAWSMCRSNSSINS